MRERIIGGILTIIGMLLVTMIGLMDMYVFPPLIRFLFVFGAIACLCAGLDLLIPDNRDKNDDEDDQNAGPLAY